MSTTRIVIPANARKGDIIDIKTLVRHEMETGHRRDHAGRPVPRDIIHTLIVTYAGETIFQADMHPGVAANPYMAFTTTAVATGDVVFTWLDDRGGKVVETRKLTVT